MSSLRLQCPPQQRFCWTLPRALLAGGVFLTPFALLLLKLNEETGSDDIGVGEDRPMLLRFVVIGVFACLMTQWCIHWMKGRR